MVECCAAKVLFLAQCLSRGFIGFISKGGGEAGCARKKMKISVSDTLRVFLCSGEMSNVEALLLCVRKGCRVSLAHSGSLLLLCGSLFSFSIVLCFYAVVWFLIGISLGVFRLCSAKP